MSGWTRATGRWICAAALALAGTATANAVTGALPAKAEVAKQAKALLTQSIDPRAPGAAVIVARGDEVLFRGAHGLANIELGVPLSPDHVFLVGSNSKLFTAVTVMTFVDAGRLSLDDPLSKSLPDFPGGEHITIHQLLNHTSGIKDFASLPPDGGKTGDFSTADLIDLFRSQPPDFAPGADWRYSNSGYVLLGAILEKLGGKPWYEVIRDKLLQPLALQHTRYSEVAAIYPGRVAGYSHDENGRLINVDSADTSGANASGGLASTLDDLLHWLRALHTGHVLSPESYRRLTTPLPSASGASKDYGYGLFNFRLRGTAGFWHSGNIGGFASAQAYFPGPGITVIVLTNADTPPPDATLLMQKLSAIALGKPFPARVPARLDDAQLRAVTGVYMVGNGILRRISLENGKLQIQRSDGAKRELPASSADEFYLPDRLAWFRPVRDASGRVIALDLYDGSGDPPKREVRTGGDEVPAPPAAAQ